MMTLGDFLRARRRARGWTLGQLSLRAGVNKGTVSRWETGAYWPRVPELLNTLEALGASPADRSEALNLLDAPRAVVALRIGAAPSAAMPVSLGEVLYSLRRRAGRTQAEAARGAGVSRSLVSQWEHDDALPTEAQRHALGFALGASADEAVVLSTRAFAQVTVERSREALMQRYQDGFVWEAGATEASERLYLLTLLGGFGRLLRAGRADVGDLALIASSCAAHAESWHNDLRRRDLLHRRALALAAESRTPLHFHIASSVRVLLDADANPCPLAQRVSAAQDWLRRFPSAAGQAYLLSFLAGALAQEAPDEALRLSDRSCALVAADPDEAPCRLHDRGNLLRKAGRAAESVAYLAALTPQDSFREGLLQLDMAEGLVALDARSEAARCLTRARTILEGLGMEIGQIEAQVCGLEAALG